MPGIEEEIEAAREEGVRFHFLTAPARILGKNGKVTGLECVRMELGEFDAGGRKTPRPIKGSEYKVDADMVIEAIGQRPDGSFAAGVGVKVGKGGTVFADPRTLATDREGIFAGGDVVTGPWTVIEAIAAGQRAASSIKRYLQGKALSPIIERNGHRPIAIPSSPPTEEETHERMRVRSRELPIAERVGSFKSFREVVLSYTREEAMAEASRCLRCDLEVGGE